MKAKRVAVAASLVLAFWPAMAAHAAKYWKNSVGSGVWTNGANWSAVSAAGIDNAGVPVSSDNVNIAPTDGAARTVTYDYAGPPIALGGVLVDLTGPGTNSTTFSMSSGNLTTIGFIIADTGRATFNHSGGAFTANDPAFDGAVGYGAGSLGLYSLSGSAALSVAKDLYVGNGASSLGVVNQTGGTSTIGSRLLLGNNPGSAGAYSISSATLSVGDDLIVGGTGIGTLTIQNNATVHVTDALSINNTSRVNLTSGTLRFNTVGGSGGLSRLTYTAGTIQLAGHRFIGDDPDITDLFGAAPTLTPGKGLTVEGTAALSTTVTVDGGTFSAGQLAGVSLLDLRRGTFNITNGTVTIASGGLLGSALDVNEDMIINVAHGINNQGLVTGDGEIGGTFRNAASGELRGEPGKSLKLTGGNNTNAGRINLLGGQVEFAQDLTNNVGALISGNGSLLTGIQLVNLGTINFAGTANVLGDVINVVGGKIISGGGGATIFFDDVDNRGEIRTSANGFTVFFGSVSGAGAFTGTGAVNFEGDLRPGSSPASIPFAGDVVFGPESSLEIELGGATAGAGYDQLNVAGKLTLGGTLDVSLINGFTPTVGQSFDILNWSTLSGAFSSLALPTLPAGRMWDASQLYTTGVLSVASPFSADFDEDGDVDGADLAEWRPGFGAGATHMQGDADADTDVDGADFLAWQRQLGSGAPASPTGSAIPEPTTSILASIAWALVGAHRRQPEHPSSVPARVIRQCSRPLLLLWNHDNQSHFLRRSKYWETE